MIYTSIVHHLRIIHQSDSVTNTVLPTADACLSFLLYEVKQVLEKVWNIFIGYKTVREFAAVGRSKTRENS